MALAEAWGRLRGAWAHPRGPRVRAHEHPLDADRGPSIVPVATFCLGCAAVLATTLPAASALLIDLRGTGLAGAGPGGPSPGREPWRAVTGSLVHASAAHLAGNLLLFLPLAAWRELRVGALRLLGELLALAAGVAVALRVLPPDWTTYCGLSGVVYGLLALFLTGEILRPARPEARTLAATILGAIVLKTALELGHGGWVGGAARLEEALGVRYLPGSHAGGLVAGALLALVGKGTRRGAT